MEKRIAANADVNLYKSILLIGSALITCSIINFLSKKLK